MADGVLTAAVSVTSAVGGIGESLTMPFSQGCSVCLNSCRQALRVERCGFYIHRAPHSLSSTLHVSHLWQAFLVVLFLSQPLGTARLSFAFAPGRHLSNFFYFLSSSP